MGSASEAFAKGLGSNQVSILGFLGNVFLYSPIVICPVVPSSLIKRTLKTGPSHFDLACLVLADAPAFYDQIAAHVQALARDMLT